MKTFSRHPRHNAFTFVETILILGILGIMLPMIFSILTTVASQQNKIYRLSEAKTEGDYAMAFIKQRLKNHGENIYKDEALLIEACAESRSQDSEYESPKGRQFYLTKRDTNNSFMQFFTEEFEGFTAADPFEQIIFNDNGAKTPLTSEQVVVRNFHMRCFRASGAVPPTVEISFQIYYKTNLATARPEDIALLNYKGVVRLR